MSFRGDDSRRYGHVPPAQYPVANQSQDQYSSPQRRPSFNTGDDMGPDQSHIHRSHGNSGGSEQELFLNNPTDSHQIRTSFANQQVAMAGYQHQYQAPPTPTHSAYNPQQFARTHSTSLPYHPASRGYASPTSPTYPPAPTAGGYAPAAYNPAAYATPSAAAPQRQSSAAGYSNYGYNYASPTVSPGPSNYGSQNTPAYGAAQATQAAAQGAYGSVPGHQQQYSAAATPSSANSQASSQYEALYASSYGGGGGGGGQYYNSYPANGTGSGPQSPPYPTSTAQPPYPVYSQIPVGPNYSTENPNSFLGRSSRSNSQTSQVGSPARQQGSPGIQRHPTNAPLPNRPMDDVPEEPDWAANGRDEAYMREQDSLMNEIVSDLGGSAHRRPAPINGNIPDEALETLRRYDSTASTINTSGAESGVNRFSSNASTVNRNSVPTSYDYDDDDESDPEGAAGLLAMQEDMEDRRFTSGITFPQYMEPLAPRASEPPSRPTPEEQVSSDSDFGGMDLGLYGGGYAGNLQYGNDMVSPPAGATSFDASRPLPTPQSQGSDYAPFSEASVDYGGTGGLQQPKTHRLSFDEGDERVSVHSRQSGSESPLKEDYPDMFYHPGLTNRPLPALPPTSETSSLLSVPSRGHSHSLSVDSQIRSDYHLQVERSVSLSNHSHTPQVQTPARSRTDATEERRRALRQQQMGAQPGLPSSAPDTGTPPSLAAYDTITLPTGRKRKFVPSKLTIADVKRCPEPWALSSITAWIREMTEDEQYLTRSNIEEAIVNLFCAKVPTMYIADAEALGNNVVESMFAAGILAPDEEWVKFGPGELSGVLWQLTGYGCYAPKLHEDESVAPRLPDHIIPVRCYSHHCSRTLKKMNLDQMMPEEEDRILDWSVFFHLSKEEISRVEKKEIARQNNLHEIVTTEEDYMDQLDVLRVLYRDQLRSIQPPVITASRLDKFIAAVFGKVDAVKQINKEYLLAQLKYRQREQGPYVQGYSDIFREWIRKARPIYIQYCAAYPYAMYLINKEAERNILFKQFVDMVREHKRSKRLEYTTYLRAPIARLQRYSLLLETVKKNTLQEGEEKASLAKAIEEIKAATHECDDKVAEQEKKMNLLKLGNSLVLRPGFQSVLNLDHLGRELLMDGELQRQGSKGVRWVDTHAFLFDHYLILSKPVVSRDGRGDKKYDVSKEPIPMPLLFLESMNDDPVIKQKGITAPLTRTAATTGSSTQLSKVASNGTDRPGLEHTTTGSSMSSLTAVTRLTPAGSNDESKLIYPFRVKHLGHDLYTLYASSQQDRAKWCHAIVEAKTRHARALHAQNAEPFRLRVLADGAFAYDSASAASKQPGVSIRGTPLDRAMREIEQMYGPGRGPPPVCRAQVNCAAAFEAFGKSLIAIGTDYGVFISEATNSRGWTRSVNISKVTQITVLEEFSICVLIADRSLIAYPLEMIAPPANHTTQAHDNARRPPQRLAKDVTFFAASRMKDRMLLFYKRKEGMHNTFKVLEPVYNRAAEKKSRLLGRRSGPTDSFRDFDEFYLPTECYSLNLFHTYIAIATAKGFELLTLDKKLPQSIPPDLTLPAIASIAQRIRDQRPLGMFKLNDAEFLLTYEDCAVYVDKHGEVSRTLIMEYSGKQKKAKAATMFGQYLVLFNDDYVEVRNAENGRLRQIIAGRDVRCLDYGFRGPTGNNNTGPAAPSAAAAAAAANGNGNQQQQQQQQPEMQLPKDSRGTVKIAMTHPEVPGGQIVLEMLLNDNHTEKQGDR